MIEHIGYYFKPQGEYGPIFLLHFKYGKDFYFVAMDDLGPYGRHSTNRGFKGFTEVSKEELLTVWALRGYDFKSAVKHIMDGSYSQEFPKKLELEEL